MAARDLENFIRSLLRSGEDDLSSALAESTEDRAAWHTEGIGDVYGFLQHMATIAIKPGPSLLETLRGSTDYSVVFTAEKRGTIPASMWAAAYFVFAD